MHSLFILTLFFDLLKYKLTDNHAVAEITKDFNFD